MINISPSQERLVPLYPNARYSFDTSAFIDAWHRHYPIDLFEGMWEYIETLLQDEVIILSYLVKVELDRQHDDLQRFVNNHARFVEPTEEEQQIVTKIVNHPKFDKWGTGQSDKADPFVVALAKVHDLAVITYENPRETKNSIPAACRFVDVESIKFPEFLRREDITFQTQED